jgi:hypothetical protein
MTAEQQQEKDDLIDSILEHQDGFLDVDYARIILNVMRRMPFEVVETIASSDRNVRFFIITDDDYGCVRNLNDPYGGFPPKERGAMLKTLHIDWQIVVINGILMDKHKLNLEQKQTVIAHEIAHAYLKHNQDGDDEKMEQEADDLIQSWGFKPSTSNILNTKKVHRAKERKRHDDERRLANKKKEGENKGI